MFRLRSIGEIRYKIKSWLGFIDRKDVYAACTVALVGASSFILGNLSALEEMRPPVTIEQLVSHGSLSPAGKASSSSDISQMTGAGKAPEGSKGLYVGSKASNKYHLPACIGAQKISESNQIWFATKADAEAAGYVPAGNCKGI